MFAANKNIIVDISDAKVSNKPNDILVTYSLGSCIGVALYDPKAKIGAMLHFQLPDSKLDAQRALERPFMFADTGLQLMLRSMGALGANKRNLRSAVVGGASMANGPANFEIGKRNHLSIRKCMWKAGLMIHIEDVGGSSPRNLYLNIATGVMSMRTNGITKDLK
jgi:chemotaxis protein CheD